VGDDFPCNFGWTIAPAGDIFFDDKNKSHVLIGMLTVLDEQQ